MIVVVIMGVVYSLALGSFKRAKENPFTLSIKNFREYLYTFYQKNKVELICIDRCKVCAVYVDAEKVKELTPLFDDSARFYSFDPLLGTRELAFSSLFDKDGREEEVCFRYSIYPDGVSDEMMLEYKDRVYDQPSYFGKSVMYYSIEEAIEEKRELLDKVVN